MNTSNTPLGSPEVPPGLPDLGTVDWIIFIFFLLGVWKFGELVLDLLYNL